MRKPNQREQMAYSTIARLEVERDQLKAELEKAQLIGLLAYNFDGYKAVLDERDQFKSENEALRKVVACVVSEIPNQTNRNGNAPGHCHSVPGIWDRDNGSKAGTECGWCKVWNAAIAMDKAVQS